MNEVHLTGLEGTNPLGFLAAVGVQVAFDTAPDQPRLWWSDDLTPHAVVDADFDIERIVDRALAAVGQWVQASALTPRRPDGAAMPKGDELKLTPQDLRAYLSRARDDGGAGAQLSAALVAEGSLDKQGVAKPTDLYFTAGQQKFLHMTRHVLGNVSRTDLIAGLQGPWGYASNLPSLMWDVSDDRVYALTADDPSKDEKLTNPGPEALAVLGLSRYPVFAGRGRTLTQGCSGSWTAASYSWPLWRRPATTLAVKSLMAHAYDHPGAGDRQRWFPAWGIARILRSPIRRSGQGGYGTFGPADVVWQNVAPNDITVSTRAKENRALP